MNFERHKQSRKSMAGWVNCEPETIASRSGFPVSTVSRHSDAVLFPRSNRL